MGGAEGINRRARWSGARHDESIPLARGKKLTKTGRDESKDGHDGVALTYPCKTIRIFMYIVCGKAPM